MLLKVVDDVKEIVLPKEVMMLLILLTKIFEKNKDSPPISNVFVIPGITFLLKDEK